VSGLLFGYARVSTDAQDLTAVLYAITTLPTDPRVAIAAAVPLSSLGLGPAGVTSLLFVAATPLVLAVTVARLRDLRRRAPI
jgi:hypothetical protein